MLNDNMNKTSSNTNTNSNSNSNSNESIFDPTNIKFEGKDTLSKTTNTTLLTLG